MIEGSQKSILFQFPNDIDVLNNNFIFKIRRKLLGQEVLSFDDDSFTKSGQDVLLFIPASSTRGLDGQYEAQIGYFTKPDDLVILPKFSIVIESAVIEQDEQGNGDSVFDEITAQTIIIEVNNPETITLKYQG